MRHNGCHIGERVKIVTGKIRAFVAEFNALFLRTFEYAARFDHAVKRYLPLLATASLAVYMFNRNTHVLSNLGLQPFVFLRQIHRTVPAIEPAGCSHLLVVHRPPFRDNRYYNQKKVVD